MRRSLTRRERLGRGAELDRLFKSGRRTSCPGCRLVALPNGVAWSRVAVVNARGYRGAVDRNRDRRILRESWRLAKESCPRGLDVAIVIYPGPYSPDQRRRQLGELLERSGLVRRPRGING